MPLPVAILAGGLGTRMYPKTRVVPKAMLEVCGEPFVAIQLRLLASFGYRKIVLLVGYLGEAIQSYVGNGARFGVEVSYVYDGDRQLGTAGAVAKGLPLLGDAFLLTFGDAYLRVDHGDVERSWSAAGTDGLMTIFHGRDSRETPNVDYRDGRIRAYDKKARLPGMEYTDYGLSVFRSRAFATINPNTPADLSEINQALIAQGQMAAYVVDDRPFEIGSPEGLSDTESFLGKQRDTP